MSVSEIRSFIIRHRVSIQDLSVIAFGTAVTVYALYAVDIFHSEKSASTHELTIELDEMLLLGVLLALAMLVFAIRRFREQKRETARRIAAEHHARELAFQDALTGLPNRRQFDQSLKEALASPPAAKAAHGVFLLDLNGFKQINDIHGHGIGDELLIIVGQRLLGAVRQGDLVSRFGGDEFAILAPHLAGAEGATTIARRVMEALEQPIVTGTTQHLIGLGIGIALLPDDASDVQEALRKADLALYRAKAERRSALRFFEEEMDRHAHERADMEARLRQAMEHGDIHAFYQPIVDLRTGSVVGFDVQPRWITPGSEEVPQERFLPIAEDMGLIHDLADHLLQEACSAAARWPDHVTLSFRINASQFSDIALPARVMKHLGEAGIAPSRLEIAITESALVRDLDSAQALLGRLRDAGVKIALDNFGTGYSSLYHLRNFKLDKIRIDRSFVQQASSDRESAAIINALVGLGQGLGLTIAAEGIADADQQQSLVGTGCEQGQGRLFGGPVDAVAAARFFPSPPSFIEGLS